MDADELLRRWRTRRREILDTLPAELRAEYRRLGLLIQGVLAEQPSSQNDEKVKYVPGATKWSGAFAPPEARTPLLENLEKLTAFLREHGPSTRGEILAATKIPTGSLSFLLRGPMFERVKRGFWRLREANK